ncbi:MAG: tRNA pseudouridine(13) synthase TruD [Pyrobaculum sp.]
MREAPPFDKNLGMWYYATDTCPSGGVIRREVGDFVVEEVLKDGTIVSKDGTSLASRPGGWTWIHVVKQNVDTLKLAIRLAKTLGVGRRDISIGGIKDTRAVTSQIVSIRGNVAALPQIPNVKFLGMWPMDRPITPGEIYGNKFTIVLRDVRHMECAQEALEKLKTTTVPNYYGYQRFGTIRPVSHLLGKALLRKDPEGFFHVMFCTIFPHESENAKRSRELACRGEYWRALESFSKRFIEERAVLKKLVAGSDLWNAIMAIPLEILRIYVEAAQSHLFNIFLSKRMELAPLDTPVEGDLVEINGQVSYYIEGLGGSVVLPVIGVGVRMPRGKVGAAILSTLKHEGLNPDVFLKMPRGLQTYGFYRKTQVEIKDFTYFVAAGDIALQLTLPRGSYATTILREIVKPTEPSAHGF